MKSKGLFPDRVRQGGVRHGTTLTRLRWFSHVRFLICSHLPNHPIFIVDPHVLNERIKDSKSSIRPKAPTAASSKAQWLVKDQQVLDGRVVSCWFRFCTQPFQCTPWNLHGSGWHRVFVEEMVHIISGSVALEIHVVLFPPLYDLQYLCAGWTTSSWNLTEAASTTATFFKKKGRISSLHRSDCYICEFHVRSKYPQDFFSRLKRGKPASYSQDLFYTGPKTHTPFTSSRRREWFWNTIL